jgi:hypothetical protein
MASFGNETRTTTAYIERINADGDMEEIAIEATGVYGWDETGADVTEIEVSHPDTTDAALYDSLTRRELDYIANALCEATG